MKPKGSCSHRPISNGVSGSSSSFYSRCGYCKDTVELDDIWIQKFRDHGKGWIVDSFMPSNPNLSQIVKIDGRWEYAWDSRNIALMVGDRVLLPDSGYGIWTGTVTAIDVEQTYNGRLRQVLGIAA